MIPHQIYPEGSWKCKVLITTGILNMIISARDGVCKRNSLTSRDHQHFSIILKMYFSNKRDSKYIKQHCKEKQTNLQSYSETSALLSTIGRKSKQKNSKDIQDLNNIVNQLYLINIYKTLHSTSIEYTFFSNAYRIFTIIDHILSHKISLKQSIL